MTSFSPGAPPAALQPLFALFSARRYAEMEQSARVLLQRYPNDGNVWKALSVSLQVQGADAVPALQKAIALLPRDAELPSNLGNILSDAGRLEGAVHSYERALSIKPDFADAHGNLGVALTRLGRFDAAIASLQRALKLKPGFPEAHNNLGNALMGVERRQDALAHYEQALALRPNFVQARRGQAHALRDLGRFADAATSYRLALALTPDDPDLHVNLGNALAAVGAFAAAAQSFEQAHILQPTHLVALLNRGVMLQQMGQLDAALACQRQALACDPRSLLVLNNLGNLLLAAGQPEPALQQYRRAIALSSAGIEARYNLARALRQLGRFDEALDHFRQILTLEPDNFAARSDMLFLQNYMDWRNDADLLDDARAFGARASALARPYTSWPRERGGVLRVGVVSGDLREHPVGYFAQAVFAALASQRIELFIYANNRTTDAISNSIAAHCQQWRHIDSLSDEQAAAQIHTDGIDILIDLAGHTAHNRLPLFAWRAAPLQVSWLGYCATTGMDQIDYVLTDPWVASEPEQARYVEKLWRLPETFLCFTPPTFSAAENAPAVGPLPMASAPITFGCFNNLSKVSDAVIALWSRVLLAVPGSRLFLKCAQLGAATNRASIAAQFAAHGVGSERLLLEGAAPRAAYLAAYGRVDIALDPFPYPGGTTSVEGLWMGVPVLTLSGQRALGRQGVSILRNAGLDDWIATDADDYVALAVRHASAPAQLASLRAGLRARLLNSPLCDAPRFAAHLEAALTAMWEGRKE